MSNPSDDKQSEALEVLYRNLVHIQEVTDIHVGDQAVEHMYEASKRAVVAFMDYKKALADERSTIKKLILDTGHGCSICRATPVVNVEGTYWLCGPCVLARSSCATHSVVDEIAAERQRQREKEGYGDSHDDDHESGELARAAACYAMHGVSYEGIEYARGGAVWPWDERYWKPRSHRENLIRAAALIVAEIDRMDRHVARPESAVPECAPARPYLQECLDAIDKHNAERSATEPFTATQAQKQTDEFWAARSSTAAIERDVLTLCLRLCVEPAYMNAPETNEVLERWRPKWEAAIGIASSAIAPISNAD